MPVINLQVINYSRMPVEVRKEIDRLNESIQKYLEATALHLAQQAGSVMLVSEAMVQVATHMAMGVATAYNLPQAQVKALLASKMMETFGDKKFPCSVHDEPQGRA